MSIKSIAWNYAPLGVLRTLARFSKSGFRVQEKLGIVNRSWYAYGLLSAADHAKEVGVSSIWALEFGVAAGRGLRNMVAVAREVESLTGVKIKVAGFDTGSGMPLSEDYRDHPEKYLEGDYPMVDIDKLRKDIGSDTELLIGNIDDTVDDFREQLSADRPVGFVAIDVDVYSSTVSALRLFDSSPDHYLPMTFSYFDDSSSRSHFNRFAGELLAIDEFNDSHSMRKIDIDRGVWNAHRQLGPQLWYERSFITHIFDHPWRTAAVKRAAKILPE